MTFASAVFRVMFALIGALLCVGAASAQEHQQPAVNEWAMWFSGQFANEHSFSSDTDNARMYELESRYSRLVYARGPIAVRWVAEIVPATVWGIPITPMDSAIMRMALAAALSGRRYIGYGIGGLSHLLRPAVGLCTLTEK